MVTLHGRDIHHVGEANIFIYKALTGDGVVVGGSTSYDSQVRHAHVELQGTTNVTIDLREEAAGAEFAKKVVGGHYIIDKRSSTLSITGGSTNVNLIGQDAVSFAGCIVGGSWFNDNDLYHGASIETSAANLNLAAKVTQNVVGGNYIELGRADSRVGAINVSISDGAELSNVLYGGSYIGGTDSNVFTSSVDDITVSITGGMVNKLVGGSYVERNAADCTVDQGSIFIELLGGSVGDVYAAGSQQGASAITTDDITVKVGSGATLTGTISAGYEFASGVSGSTVVGERIIEFIGTQDRRGVIFDQFDTINVATDGTTVKVGTLTGVTNLTKTGAGALQMGAVSLESFTVSEGAVIFAGDNTSNGGGMPAEYSINNLNIDIGASYLEVQNQAFLSVGNLCGMGSLTKTGAGRMSVHGLIGVSSISLKGGSLNVGDSYLLSENHELIVGMHDAVLESSLSLGDGKLSLDYSGRGAATSLNDSTLSFLGGTTLRLTGAGNGDGKTYTLFTGVSGLLDAQGNAISLDSSNNAASLYFDTSQPGTGFWADGTLQLNNGALQLVLHNEAVKEAITITTRQENPAAYQYYAGISFENISNTSTSTDEDVHGGAIYGGESTVTLSNNGSVTFSGNTASGSSYADGGAIYGSVTMKGNGDVSFSGNTASSSDSYAYGGAISSSTITLSDNGSVSFIGNTASSSSYYSDYSFVCAYGGAIYGNEDVTLSDNGSVSFIGNTVSSSYDSALGGAIYGGAYSTITLSNNGSVTFSGNTASASSFAYGGVIVGDWKSTTTLSDNGSVSFIGNTASSDSDACGGAIVGFESSTITLSDNGSVSFIGNTASSSDYSAYGGAIYGYESSTITLSDNGSVTFSGNTASSSDDYASGGAIYTAGDLSIRNNDSVEFYQNAEEVYGTYRLRSIYAGGNGGVISLSAAAGKSIEFRDLVYITSGSTVNLNEDYTYLDEEGVSVTVEQKGDIVFTGATTVDDLYTVKGNVAGTEEEIRLSRTTEVNALTNLYGGRLRVEEGAIYQGQGIMAHAGSDATVLVKDATLSHSGYALTFNAGTTLELAGANSITGNVQMLEGSWLAFDGAESKGMSWLTGTLSFTGGANVSLSGNTDWSGQNEILMYVDGSVSGWDENTLSIRNDAGSSTDLRLVNGDLLVLNYNAETFKPYFKGDLTITTRQTGSNTYNYYEDICFRGITHSSSHARGGAIYGPGDITLSNNGSVLFNGNAVCDNMTFANGGAIYADGKVTLNNNTKVEFSGNSAAISSYDEDDEYPGEPKGGAIYGDVELCDNESVSFCGNSARYLYPTNSKVSYNHDFEYDLQSREGSEAYGGAIMGAVLVAGNENALFEQNEVTHGLLGSGGAIYGDCITFSNNTSITITGNAATASYARGGAIYGKGNGFIAFSDNGNVKFTGNRVSATQAYGGAIYAYGNLSIQNNDSVLFEQNAEITDGVYRLRSIVGGGNGDVISLSAAAGKSIEFRDSVYITSGSTVNLNEDYTYLDEEGVSVTVEQKGDIVFTGATTVDDLYTVKGNVAGTEEEIRLSRTTEVNALTNLYGGRLRVEDGAIYQGQGITVHAGSDATVLVKDATLSHSGYDLAFNAGTTLELAGANSITGNVQMLEGSWLAFDGAESKGMSWLTGTLSFTGGANVSLSGNTDWSGQNEILMYVDGSVSGWDENTLSIRNDAGSSTDLRLVNGDLLVLNYNAETFKPYFKGDLTITTRQTDSDNYRYYNSVSFEKIKVDGASSTSGGAISGGGYSTITLSDNGSVVFNGNRAESGSSYALGGAIYGNDVTLNDNGSVEFIGNVAASRAEIIINPVLGGAIDGHYVTLNNNGSVKFIRNTVETEFSEGQGGAIYGHYVTLNNNGSVEFSGNGAEFPPSIGGAIYGDNVTLNDNGSVIFSENMASSHGGAIYSPETADSLMLSDNGSVKFIGNTVRSTSTGEYAKGGAIYAAAYGDDGFMLSDNGSVKFIGNTVESTSTAAYGGAIYTYWCDLSIRNNDLVEFYQNAEVVKGIYCLRSIYANYPLSEISLSAAAGKSIKFYDSVYIVSGATVNLNADYTYLDDDGVAVTVEQKGDILFTGATTVDDLYTVKGNVAGTEEEIRLSRTTEVNALTNLYGGRLRVEEGAIYQGQGITAHAGSEATVLVKDAELRHAGYNLTFNAGTTLELAGANTIIGNVQMLEGSTLRFDFGADAASSLTGSLRFENATTLQVSGYGAGLHELLRLNGSTVSGWDALSFTDGAGESVDAADFAQVGDSLFYRNGEAMNLIWTNAAGDALWNNKSLNWTADEMPYAVSVLQNVIFAAGGNETITMVGNQVVESLTVQQGGQFVLNGNADGTTLTVREDVLLEGNTALTVRGNLEAGAINAQGSLEVTGDLAVSGQVIAASLTLSDATATHTIGGNVTLSGAATVAGMLEVSGSFTSGAVQVKKLMADGTVSTGAISSSDNSLTATGNMTTGAVTGDRNELTSTGGYVLLRNNAALNGSSNKLNAAHVVQVGTITGDGNELVAGKHVDINGSLNGDENSITCNATVNTTDNAIDISGTIGSATNTADDNALYAVRGNIRTGAIAGSGNTLTAQDGNITTGAITGNDNVLSAVNGVVTAGAIAGTGNVVTAKSLQAAGMEGASLTLTDATATNRIDGNVTLSGAATVAGELTVSGSFYSGTLQVKSLTAGGSITTGKLTGDSATLTALNGNVELTNEHESLNGNSNVITATGGDVRLTDDMIGSHNVIAAVAVDGVGGSILRGNGSPLWASIVGQHNELTADGRIELESINQGNNTLIAGGDIVNDGGTISINSINGSTNTLTATNGSIRVGNIGNAAKSDNNRLTAAGHVYVQGKLTGDGNYLESNKAPGDGNSISIWNGINGSGNRILANAGNIAMGGGDLTGDNNTLTSVNGNVSVRNVSGTGNTLSAGKGNIVVTSISGTGASLTAANLQVNGAGGLNLTDSVLNITGDVTSAGNVVLAGSDNTAQWSAGRIAGSGSVSITGGVLELADDTDALAVTGAVSISNAELHGSWTGTDLSIGGSAVVAESGIVLQNVVLTSGLSNEGSLSFGGAVTVQADGLSSVSSTTRYSAGASGYRYEVKDYTLVTGSGTTSALDGTVWSISGDANVPVDASYSYANGILTATGAQERSSYWVNDAVVYDGRSEFDTADTLVFNGGPLTLATELGSNLTGGIQVETAGTLTIGSGVEVVKSAIRGASSSNKVTLAGAGALNMGASADFSGYELGTGWTGTVVLSGITSEADLKMTTIGRGGSTIELENVKGHTGVKNGTVQANLVLNKSTAADGTELAAFLVSNGYSSTTEGYVMTTFSGMVSGAGKIAFNRSLTDTYTGFKFTGNVADWTGAFEMQGGKTFNLVFGGIATEIKADIRDTSSGSTLNLMLEAETAMTLAGTISTDSILVSTTPGVAFKGTVNTGKLSAGNSVLTFGSAAAVTGDMSAAGVVLNAGASLDVNGALNTGSLSAAGSAVTLGAASVVSGEMSAAALVLNAGASLDVGGTLSAAQVTLKNLNATEPTLTVGSFAAGDTIFTLDAAALNALNLGHGESVVIARADSAIGSGFNAWLGAGSTSLDAAVYRYDISVSGADVLVSMDYANWGTRVWYEGAWVGKEGWSEYMIAGYDAVNGVETVDLGGESIQATNLFLAQEGSTSTSVLSNGSIEAACTEIVEGNLTIAEDATLDSDELIAAGHDILLQGELIVNNGSIGTLSGTTGTLVIGGEVSVDSNVTLGILDNSGTLDIGSHKLNVAAVVSNGGNVTAGEVVVHNRYGNPAEFDTLVADKVIVTNTSSKYPDYLSVGGGSVIGELVADKLEVREGLATLGSTAKQTEQELQSIALQKGADLVLQGQTSLSVTDSVAMTAGSEVQIQSGSTLQNGAIALSAAPGTAAALLSSKAGGDLVMMQQAGGLCIQDVLLVNTCISAAEGTEVMLSGVEGSENVHLLGGADFSLTFADNKADVGMAVIENSSPVTGITLSAGSTLTLVMDPTNNDFRDYNLVINMSGFEYEGGSLAATGGITDLNAAGIYLGGRLGELLAGQGVVQNGVGNLESPEVPGDSIPTVSYTYSTDDNVGMIISIHGLSVPEPATTSLSLAALVALAMRRRRR